MQGNFRGTKLSRISRLGTLLQKYKRECAASTCESVSDQSCGITAVLASTMSGILKYFKRTNETTLTLKAREMAEKEVKKVEEAVAEAARTGMKRGHYDFLSDKNKAKVAKYAL